MAARKRTQQQVEVVAPSDLLGDDVFDAEQLAPALQKLYAELGIDGDSGQVTVYVYKVGADAREPRIWQGSPDEYDLWTLAKKFGSGDYRVKMYGPHPRGHNVVVANRVFPILLDPSDDAKIEAARNPALNAAPAQSMTPEAISVMIGNAVRAAMPVTPAVDPIAQMRQMAEVMKIMQPAQIPAPIAQPLNDPLQTLGLFKQFSEIMNIGKSADLPADADSSTVMLSKGLDLLTNIVTAQRNGSAPTVPQLPAPAQVAQPAPIIQHAPTVPMEVTEMGLMIRAQLSMVTRAAAQNVDVESYADMAATHLPDEFIDMLRADDWFEKLQQMAPACTPYQPWFLLLRTRIFELLAEDESGDLTSGHDDSVESQAKQK